MFRPIAAACDVEFQSSISGFNCCTIHASFHFSPPCSYFDDETSLSIIAGSVF